MATLKISVKTMIAAFLPLLYLPGIIVGLVPVCLVLIFGESLEIKSLSGVLILLPAIFGIFYCSWLFASHGQSIAPWKKPKKLLRKGPYSLSRNPIFVFMIQAAVGWGLIFNSFLLLFYAVLLVTAFHHRIKREEKALQQLFPDQWSVYCLSTPRWLF